MRLSAARSTRQVLTTITSVTRAKLRPSPAAPADLRLLPKATGLKVLAGVLGSHTNARHDVTVKGASPNREDRRVFRRQEPGLGRDPLGIYRIGLGNDEPVQIGRKLQGFHVLEEHVLAASEGFRPGAAQQ